MPEVTATPPPREPEAARAQGWQPYHTLWAMLLGGWLFSYADRTITGPVVTWLIETTTGCWAPPAIRTRWAG